MRRDRQRKASPKSISSEIPVSVGMVEAGRLELSAYEPGLDDSGEFVVAIYRAMELARLRASPPPASRGTRLSRRGRT